MCPSLYAPLWHLVPGLGVNSPCSKIQFVRFEDFVQIGNMVEHLKNIKLSISQMLGLNAPAEELLRYKKDSIEKILKLDTLLDKKDASVDEATELAVRLHFLDHKINSVEARSQQQRETLGLLDHQSAVSPILEERRMNWNDAHGFFEDLVYSITTFKFVFVFAKFLEDLCLKQDQINSHDLKDRARKLGSEAELTFKEQHQKYETFKGTVSKIHPLTAESYNWSMILEKIQQISACLSSKLKEMRIGYTIIVEDLCTKQMQIPCFWFDKNADEISQMQMKSFPDVVELGASASMSLDEQLELMWRVRSLSLKIGSVKARCSIQCQRLELLQRESVNLSVELRERSSHYIFSKFLRAAAYSARVLGDVVNTSKFLEDLVKQDKFNSDKLKSKARDLMLKTKSVLEVVDQLLSEIRDEHQKIASLKAESCNWSKVLVLIQQESLITLFKLKNIRDRYIKIAGDLNDKPRTKGCFGGAKQRFAGG